MLGTQGQMEQRVLSVLRTISNPDWDLLLALRVWLTLPLELVVSLTQPASVMLGTQGQMEQYVHNVLLTITKQDWALLLALRVWLTQSLKLEVS